MTAFWITWAAVLIIVNAAIIVGYEVRDRLHRRRILREFDEAIGWPERYR